MVKSAQRVFQIYELFERVCRPLRVGEIVTQLNLPQSSVSMLLSTLVECGYMEFDPQTREFCPSPRVSFLADWAVRVSGQRQAIQDMMRGLAQSTGETVLLGRQNGLFMQYVSMIESEQEARLSVSPGARRPMHRAAVGVMLLSTLNDEYIGRLLRRFNAEHSREHGVARIATVMRMVEQARADGWFVSEGLNIQGTGVVATLLATQIRGHYLSVGVGGPLGRLRPRMDKIIALVRRAGQSC